MNTFARKIQSRLDQLTKPQGSLGYLEDIVVKLGTIQKTEKPRVQQKRIIVFASDHGIANEQVSAYPSAVTYQMVLNFVRGGAAINVLAKKYAIDLRVVDMGVNGIFQDDIPILHRKIRLGTRNFLYEDAMTEGEVEKALMIGRKLARQAKKDDIDLLGVGDMGIGNTSSASAITASLLHTSIREVTGRGTGLNDTQLAHKISLLETALKARNMTHAAPREILRKVGGYEIAAITGIALGCAQYKIAFVVDGFITSSAVAIAAALNKKVREVIFASHLSQEKGHRYLLEYLQLKPFLTLDMRLGEGTGAAIAMGIIEGGVSLYTNMATFISAHVDEKL